MNLPVKILLVSKRMAKAILPQGLYEKLRKFMLGRMHSPRRRKELPGSNAQKLPFGVNLFAYNTNNSAGSQAYLICAALTAASIPFQVIDLSDPEKFNAEKSQCSLYRTNLIICHAASGTPQRMKLFDLDLSQHYNIGYWAWELAEVPEEYCAGIELFQEIWTISTFCTAALEKKARVPVLTVPLCANPDREIIENGREYFNIHSDPFLFMFAYDCNSFVHRKNPQAVVQAFQKAFSPEENVGLILKLLCPESAQGHMDELKQTLSPYKHVYFVDKYLTYEENRTLLKISDAFVSLHRSEGYGLLPLEAMSLGTPVISTEWSGNMEYMNHMNAALVGYTMVPVDGKYCGSVPGDGLMWAEADVEEAAAYMRRMVSDKLWRDGLIANGDYTANKCFTAEKIGKIMRERLARL